ncbi:FAA hydrolase family protein [Pseudidiomarina sediminum]|uniref:FAA hydrolase family protein n=1 Tax=Pseudidiomarina sediminum TaxID=431675 RepID=A0A432Z8H5_9GAMM|nr:FAA hydrolase family protein [Pseudidiomarina sediminum]
MMPRPSKIVCVGRNYAAHAAELNNPIPSEPLLFIKPASSLAYFPEVIIPTQWGECHHELEIAVQVNRRLQRVDATTAAAAVAQATLALDLTLRDVQSQLKQQGYPWERAKAFDGACVLAPWVTVTTLDEVQQSRFQLSCDGVLRQQGDGRQMLTPIAALIAEISQVFTLEPGDVVLTGTPAGVGPLQVGEQLCCEWQLGEASYQWQAKVTGHD